MKRVMDNEFKSEHQVTIGVEFGSFGLKVDGKILKLQIWDTVRNDDVNRSIGWARVIQVGNSHILSRGPLRVPDIRCDKGGYFRKPALVATRGETTCS